MTQISRSNKILLLNYKITIETFDIVNEEYNKGMNNLNSILTEFRKNLDDKNQINQQKKFDHIFFNSNIVDQKNIHKNQKISKKKDNNINLVKIENKNDIIFKKMLKSIVKLTHPDKTLSLSYEIKEKLTNLYLQSIKAYKNKNYAKLIYIASELNIKITNNLIKDYIKPSIEKVEKSIFSTKTKIGYVWFHLDDKEKIPVLKQHLQKMGFIFTEKKVKDVIKRKKPMRRPGIKPIKIKRKK